MHHQAYNQKSDQEKDSYHSDFIYLRKMTGEGIGKARLALVYIARETSEFRETISEAKSELEAAATNRNVLNDEFREAAAEILQHTPQYERAKPDGYQTHRIRDTLEVAIYISHLVEDLLAAEKVIGLIRKSQL